MPFYGRILTKDGLKPDPHKVDVILQWPTSTCVTELQSFLGSVNYLCKFIPYLSDLRQPLQELLKSNNEFYWTQQQSDPLNSYSLNSSFCLICRGNLKVLKALAFTPMLNYPLNSSPHLVHHKISVYFSDELNRSNCT